MSLLTLFSGASASSEDKSDVAAYQAEVARRARMTPEELAENGGATLLGGLPWDQRDEASVAVQTAQRQRATSAAIEASNAVFVPPQAPPPQPASMFHPGVQDDPRPATVTVTYDAAIAGESLGAAEVPPLTSRSTWADAKGSWAEQTGPWASSDAAAAASVSTAQAARIGNNAADIFALAIHFEQLARVRIEALRGLNDPVEVERTKSELDLLTILADGLGQIASALEAFANDPQPMFLGQVGAITNYLKEQLQTWLDENKREARELLVRIPSALGAVQLFHMAGADMYWATALVAASFGTEKALKVYQVLRGHKKDGGVGSEP